MGSDQGNNQMEDVTTPSNQSSENSSPPTPPPANSIDTPSQGDSPVSTPPETISSTPTEPIQQTPLSPTVDSGTTSSPPEVSTPSVDSNFLQTPTNSPTPNKTPGKKKNLKKLLVFIVVGVLLIGGFAGVFLLGKSKQKVVIQAPEPKTISLPPEAIVTQECVLGRGKQYIIPKDIPQGPYYDVKDGKVIAMEYTIGIGELLFQQSDKFSDIILTFTKQYSIDHFLVVPQMTQEGTLSQQEINLIMFVVPKEEAATITCGKSQEEIQQIQQQAQQQMQAAQQAAQQQ